MIMSTRYHNERVEAGTNPSSPYINRGIIRMKGIVLGLMLMVVLTACGTNSTQPSNAENTVASTESSSEASLEATESAEATNTTESEFLDAIKASGVIKVGTEGTYAPFTFHDASGELTGFDVEIAREVARRLGVEAEFVETKWDGIFAGLDAERFDFIANQVGIREDRLEKYDFSIPYIQSKAVLIVKGDDDTIQSFADLAGKKAGQSLTSNYGDIARSNGAEIVAVDGFNQSIDLLLSGRIDGTINDSLSFYDFLKQRPDVDLRIAASEESAAQSGLMFRKGNADLVEAINEALKGMIEDGTYLEISEKWFGEDVLK